jgi:hypothetical protein
MGSIKRVLESFDRLDFLGECSKKGSTRKYTKNRVTSWTNVFWGNSEVLR